MWPQQLHQSNGKMTGCGARVSCISRISRIGRSVHRCVAFLYRDPPLMISIKCIRVTSWSTHSRTADSVVRLEPFWVRTCSTAITDTSSTSSRLHCKSGLVSADFRPFGAGQMPGKSAHLPRQSKKDCFSLAETAPPSNLSKRHPRNFVILRVLIGWRRDVHGYRPESSI